MLEVAYTTCAIPSPSPRPTALSCKNKSLADHGMDRTRSQESKPRTLLAPLQHGRPPLSPRGRPEAIHRVAVRHEAHRARTPKGKEARRPAAKGKGRPALGA
ncbi:hypothetical protein COCMIDRAFT_109560 [Bipolaris oryzae ATCC 44560]|uniref:Uncharacterized protein n=1 Tax=Bipolaris oryzae ATCC 44560 TaxID=930090 RepID=W6YR82_COCMI|nr:uncharacterized protein COCMIDRAFT_109560 [Bipolaris oryzae ATCC 44560]EUC40145.1 hypothetical protein COCMIDRAFT_109560 [Bipolaris oryzae ATCC 44560]